MAVTLSIASRFGLACLPLFFEEIIGSTMPPHRFPS
jgi:hypothetical protein